MNTPTITVDIVSDIVCPWCWLGKKYFDNAIEKTPDIDVQVNWRPFMLDAGIPSEGMPYFEYMQKKFGGGPNNKFKTMRNHLEKAAAPAGIAFNFDDIPMRPNTLKAHLLLQLAAEHGKDHAVSEALFKAFFQDLEDIGDLHVLLNIAAENGINKTIAKKFLAAKQDKLADELAYFQKLGITSVPSFIYNGTFAVSGGQPMEVHKQAIEKASTTTAKDIMTVLGTQ